MDPTVRAFIEEKLRTADVWATHPNQLDAIRHGALLIWADIGGWLALRPDGTVIGQAWDDEKPPKVETDPVWLRVIATHGAALYPELKPLVPARPPEAIDCPHEPAMAKLRARGIVGVACECGDLGWVLPSER